MSHLSRVPQLGWDSMLSVPETQLSATSLACLRALQGLPPPAYWAPSRNVDQGTTAFPQKPTIMKPIPLLFPVHLGSEQTAEDCSPGEGRGPAVATQHVAQSWNSNPGLLGAAPVSLWVKGPFRNISEPTSVVSVAGQAFLPPRDCASLLPCGSCHKLSTLFQCQT